jgi:hypothetical protein
LICFKTHNIWTGDEKNTNIDEIVRKNLHKVNLKYIILPYFRQNMYYEDQNCQILKLGNQNYKMVKIEGQKLQLNQYFNGSLKPIIFHSVFMVIVNPSILDRTIGVL